MKKLNLKQLSQGFEKVASSSNKVVRTTGMSVYEELYKFMKDGVMVFVDKLGKPQQEELKKIFEKLAVEGANPIPVPVEAAANPYEQAPVVED